MIFKTGLNPAPEPPRLEFKEYFLPLQLPPIPATFGHYGLIDAESWGMLANDRVGDCTVAGAMHCSMLWNKMTGTHVVFTDLDARDDYFAITGGGDTGVDIVQQASYWKKTGFRDNHNRRHKIGAYLQIDATRLDHIDAAVYLFGAVGFGVAVGDREEQEFLHHQPWTSPGPVDGYHYVPMVGKDPDWRKVVTWGGLQDVGEGWLDAQLKEVVAMVSAEALVGGKSMEGFDMEALLADLEALA